MKALLTTGLLTFLGVMLPLKGSYAQAPDTIYFGGPIYTMVHDGDRVEALAVANGMIVAFGAKDDILKTKGPDTKPIDLGGKCLLPGFVDPHSHVVQQALKFSVVNLDPYPIGDVKSIEDIQRKLHQRIEETTKLEPGKWLFGWGYDDTGVVEGRHPTREDLDAVSTTHPILLMHISSHLMTANSKALELAGITADTPDPEREQRFDILEWVISFGGINEIWISPRTGEYVNRCPWLRKLPKQNKYICRIHETKPEHCQNFPKSKRHALDNCCKGFPTE